MNTVQHLRSGALVRLLPDWHADIGPISLYFAGLRQLPGKTRAFVDFIVEECGRRGLAQLLSAAGGIAKQYDGAYGPGSIFEIA